MKRTLLLAVVLLVPCLSAPAAEVKFGGKTFTLPDGFTLERVAGPPLVDRPIVADFDEKGRLYVADSSGSNEPPKVQLQKKPHRIVRLEDVDGDGTYDKSTVFADRMMFPEGAMWFEGSLYVAAPPQIWKLTDLDDDGVADRREVWFDGKTLTGCANDLHGPYRGPDGRIYWCKGAFAEQTYERKGKAPFVTRAAHIFRAEPDGTDIEVVMTGGMDNPVDVVFTPDGEPIFSCTFLQHPAEGRRDGLIHAVYGGVWGKTNDALDGHPRTGPDLMPVMTHLGPAAPCGLTRYESTAFGPDFRDNLFACQFNLRKVSRHVLIPDGSTFKTADSDFLASADHDFHPTDVVEDADGSLLVVDTGGWYKLCCPTSQLEKPDVLGAIYRIRRAGAAKVDDPRGLRLDWDKAGADALAERLGDARPAVRRRASEALAQRREEGLTALDRMVRDPRPECRLAAVWTLARIDRPFARGIVRAALDDRDETVRRAAARVAGLWRDSRAVSDILPLTRGTTADRRVAAEALGRIGATGEAPALFESLARDADRGLEHAVTYALIEFGVPQAATSGLGSGFPAARRAAMVALDQIEGNYLPTSPVLAGLGSAVAADREVALWVAGHHPEWGGLMARWFRERLRAGSLTEAEREALTDGLARLAKAPEVRDLIGATLVDPDGPPESHRIALRAMARAGLKTVPVEWVEGLASALTADGDGLVSLAVATVRGLGVGADEGKTLVRPLLEVVGRPTLPVEVRVGALAAVPGGPGALSPGMFELVRRELDPGRAVASRLLAAEALAKARLSAEQLSTLAGEIDRLGPMEVDRLLPAFEATGDEATGLRLVEALGRPAMLASLRVDMIRPRLAKYGPPVQRKAEELYAKLNADAARQKARVDELLATLPKGDVRRGQAVFNGTKAACLTCHAVGYVGGRVGPDLSGIGKIRQPRDLIESIVYPSASFVRSYEPVVVLTKEGRSVAGVVRRDGPDGMVLATGPDREERIDRAAIEEVRPGTVSVMPAGLDAQLTPQDLADLLAFLLSRK